MTSPELLKVGFVNVIRCGRAWTYANLTNDVVLDIPWANDPGGTGLVLAPGQSHHYPDARSPAWESWDWGADAEGGCRGR